MAMHRSTQRRLDRQRGFASSVFLLLLPRLHVGTSLQTPAPSQLTNTKWKLTLDVGVQPGTWMPKRFPGWGESGARLGLDVQVQFADDALPPGARRESLVGPKESTRRLKVVSDASTFVSERGQQSVTFADGGWCIQRPTGNVRNASGGTVKPEGLLRFWLDCTTGARRRDVEIRPDTRIFFTTGVWDKPEDIKRDDDEYRDVLAKLQDMVDRTKEERNRILAEKTVLEEARFFGKMLGDSKEFDQLKERKEALERELPPLGTSVSRNGVQIAPTGSLVIKGNSIPDWLPGSEYLILGTFSTTSLES